MIVQSVKAMIDLQTSEVIPELEEGEGLAHYQCCIINDIALCGRELNDFVFDPSCDISCVVCLDLDKNHGWCPRLNRACPKDYDDQKN